MEKNRLSWLIGGAQGTGVDSAANIFAKVCASGGLNVYGKREYYSNIKGEHSYFHVRIDEKNIRSSQNEIALLATFDAETIVRHYRWLKNDGGIVYDPGVVNTKINMIPTIERRLLVDVSEHLAKLGLGQTVNDVLEEAVRKGVRLYPIPYGEILKEVAQLYAESQLSKLARMTNILAVAGSFSLLRFGRSALEQVIKASFKGKVADMNIAAAEKAFEYVQKKYSENFGYRLENIESQEKRIFLQGNQAIALGKLLGGCRFQTYYPISPATDESVYLEAHENFGTVPSVETANPMIAESAHLATDSSIVVLQTEDEIAAITSAIGAALTGTRAATSTSGPGYSLMVEGVGWAGINEVPLVVTLYQRGGPSTGMPTRSEQGDLRFAIHTGHGEFPRIVLASGDLVEAFYDAIRAFNYAEQYQLPVIHLVDKTIASTTVTTHVFDTGNVPIHRGHILNENALTTANLEKYKRFAFTESGVSPRAVLGTLGGISWNTGDEHDEFGHITEDPVDRMRMMEKRMRKLDLVEKEIPKEEKLNFFGQSGAEVNIVSWGSPKGAILDAMDALENELDVNFVQLRLLHPLPRELVTELLTGSTKISIEMNYSSQLSGIIREQTGILIDNHIVKYNGRPATCDEVFDAVKTIVAKKTKRVVLSHGA